MCISTPKPVAIEAAPIPSAAPMTTTSSADSANAILSQFTEATRRKGLASTVRNTGGSGGIATAGSATSLGQGA